MEFILDRWSFKDKIVANNFWNKKSFYLGKRNLIIVILIFLWNKSMLTKSLGYYSPNRIMMTENIFTK